MTICKKCKGEFQMGVNGTVDGCDTCCKVKRDPSGRYWKINEKYHIYQDLITKKLYKVYREEAFASKTN